MRHTSTEPVDTVESVNVVVRGDAADATKTADSADAVQGVDVAARSLSTAGVLPSVCFAMDQSAFDACFDSEAIAAIREVATVLVDDTGRPLLVHDLEAVPANLLDGVEILITGWGAPTIDAVAISRFTRLRAIVHSAGTVKTFLDPSVWDTGVHVSSAAVANAVPVAEFTLASVIFAAKRVSRHAATYRATADKSSRGFTDRFVGTRGITVGVVGASRIGRLVIELLRVLDASVLVSDPFLSPAEAQGLGVELVEFPELLRRSDIVTLHAPDLPATRHMLNASTIALMRDGAVLINTARGALVDTAALEPHLVSGRLDAVLDVTEPEPLPADSPLYQLPNVTLTPHIAGSMGNEVRRMGLTAVDEVRRIARHQPLQFPVNASDLERIA